VQNGESTVECLTIGIQPCYYAATASEPDNKPERLRVSRKENRHMSANFFKLPESVKRRIWAELLEQWAKRKPATH
jgi:hypothetical protein